MKTKNILALLAFIFSINSFFGQIQFQTGDKSLDSSLTVLNADAKKDLAKFKESAATELGLSKEKIQQLLDKKMEPAEVILAGRISILSKKPIDDVVKSYERNKGKGWGVVAKEMGIKPGSPEFHALKGKAKKGNSGKGKSKEKSQSKEKEQEKGKSTGKGKGKG